MLAGSPKVVVSVLATGPAVLPKARAVGEFVGLRAVASTAVSKVALLKAEPIGTNVHPP